jgi:hypothetical protein
VRVEAVRREVPELDRFVAALLALAQQPAATGAAERAERGD